MSKCSPGFGNEFRAATLDEVAGFGDDRFENLHELTEAGFPVDEFGGGFASRWIELNVARSAERSCSGFVFQCGCHTGDAAPIGERKQGAGAAVFQKSFETSILADGHSTDDWGSVLEATFEDADRPFGEVFPGSRIREASRAIQLGEPFLLKLHGDRLAAPTFATPITIPSFPFLMPILSPGL
jgi:hypothetical protein